MLLYGEWVEQNVLAPVAHRQYVFTLPKLLRPIFSRQRAWLGELCRIAARLLTDAYTAAAPCARPGLVLFVQTFGGEYRRDLDPVAGEFAPASPRGMALLPISRNGLILAHRSGRFVAIE